MVRRVQHIFHKMELVQSLETYSDTELSYNIAGYKQSGTIPKLFETGDWDAYKARGGDLVLRIDFNNTYSNANVSGYYIREAMLHSPSRGAPKTRLNDELEGITILYVGVGSTRDTDAWDALGEVAALMPKLKRIDIRSTTVSEDQMAALLKRVRGLERLVLLGVTMHVPPIAKLIAAGKLRVLSVEACRVPGSLKELVLSTQTPASKLHTLTIVDCYLSKEQIVEIVTDLRWGGSVRQLNLARNTTFSPNAAIELLGFSESALEVVWGWNEKMKNGEKMMEVRTLRSKSANFLLLRMEDFLVLVRKALHSLARSRFALHSTEFNLKVQSFEGVDADTRLVLDSMSRFELDKFLALMVPSREARRDARGNMVKDAYGKDVTDLVFKPVAGIDLFDWVYKNTAAKEPEDE